jgi:TldD protein
MRRILSVICIAALAAPLAADEPPPEDERLIILQAMREELDRSMSEIEIEDFEGPYFMSYLVTDERQTRIGAANGAIAQERGGHSRIGYVEIRCGDMELDNSRAGSGMPLMFFYYGQYHSPLPIENDPTALRTALWQITDETYKQAVQDHLTRQGEEVMRVEQEDRPDDFSPADPERHVDPPLEAEIDEELWRGRLRHLSSLFNEHPWIESSHLTLRVEMRTQWYVNSEGSEILQEEQDWSVFAECNTTAPEDGQPLNHSLALNFSRPEDLPDEEELSEEIERVIAELEALRAAPVLDPYTGPALLAPDVTGVLFHEAIGHRLEGERQRDDDRSGQTFAGKIGEEIIPAFISVCDDPTLVEFEGVGINGGYGFDQEGIRARRVSLIENGVLQTYLMSRTPNEYVTQSNGHGRSDGLHDPEARMGTLIVETSEPQTYEELRERLIEVCREEGHEFGLIVHDISGGYTNTSNYGFQAFAEHPRIVYRVDAETGEEELVRGVDIVGTPLSSINKIVAMGGESDLFNGFCGAGSGTVPQAQIAPWSLSLEVEFQRSSTENRRPPLLPPPFTLD